MSVENRRLCVVLSFNSSKSSAFRLLILAYVISFISFFQTSNNMYDFWGFFFFFFFFFFGGGFGAEGRDVFQLSVWEVFSRLLLLVFTLIMVVFKCCWVRVRSSWRVS